ncbi:MAG TPA: hypothetical protein VN421_10310 [Pseudoflavonifractor sp.]|nr:hypothetical protein [Pseudoflavonifractor sp.]
MASAAIVLVFFALVIPLGLIRGFRRRSRRENVFYLFTIAVSLTALLFASLRG